MSTLTSFLNKNKIDQTEDQAFKSIDFRKSMMKA